MRLSPIVTTLAGIYCLSLTTTALAEDGKSDGPEKAGATQRAIAAPKKPKLIVAISVDQLSADLFAEYRPYYRGRIKTAIARRSFPLRLPIAQRYRDLPGSFQRY